MAFFGPLAENERDMFPGYTHIWTLDQFFNADLTQSALNTNQVFNPFSLKANDRIERCAMILHENFQNTADAAFNSTTISVGDQASATQFITAQQINQNGTVVPSSYNSGASIPISYTAATAGAVQITFASMAGKALVNLNRGRVHVLFSLFRPDPQLYLRSVGPPPPFAP